MTIILVVCPLLIVGGNANNGANAGFAYSNTNNAPSNTKSLNDMIITNEIIYRGRVIRVKDLKPYTMMKVIVQCPICGNWREAYYRSVKDNQICHGCAMKTKLSKTVPIGEKYGRLTVIMPYEYTKSICVCDCGTELIVDNYSLTSGHTKSCGCIQKEHSAIIGRIITSEWRGENHPNWKGGISSERQRFNASNEAKKWREDVFKRDEYTCQSCGVIGGTLNAHHIKQFATHPKLRLDINNGITLCEECHRTEHKKTGKRKIRKENIMNLNKITGYESTK